MGTPEESAGLPKAVVTIAAIGAGLVAQKLVSVGWRFVRGTDPGSDDDSPLPETLIFAAVNAASVAVAKNWTVQRAKRVGA